MHDEEEDDYDEEVSEDETDPTFTLSKSITKHRASKKPIAAAAGSDEEEEDEVEGSDEEADDEDVDSEAGSMDEDMAEEERDHPTGSARETGAAPLREFASRFDTDMDTDDEETDDDDLNYLQKFEEGMKSNIIDDFHPELKAHNYDEVDRLCQVVRNEHGSIVDPLHRTLPFLTKYEKARIIGERAKQINAGAKPWIAVEPNIIDGYVIAMMEFEQKKIPFIVKRPLPNGGCEYWKLRDLEVV